jgi:predicted nucleotidyltransferase
MAGQPSKNFMDGRPPKLIFSKSKQSYILAQIKQWIANNLPPNTALYEKRIFGSLAKGTFGKYQTEFKGRKFSDVDILFVVDDDFSPPKEWKVHFECVKDVWVVYDVAIVPIDTEDETVFVEVQYIILKKTYSENIKTITEAEKWGIPLMKSDTKNKYISL